MSAAANRGRARLWISLSAALALSAFFLWLLLRRIDLARVLPEIAKASLPPLAASLGSKLVGFLGLTVRARALLRPVAALPFATVFRGQLLGFAANNIIPFRLGELVKVDYIARHGAGSRSAVLAVAAAERILDLVCLLALFALVSSLVLPSIAHPGAIAATAFAVLLAAAAAWLLAGRAGALFTRLFPVLERRFGHERADRLSGTAERFSRGFAGLRSPVTVLAAFAGSALYWGCAFLSVRLCLDAFAITTAWYAPAVVLVFLAFGTALPASPGFVGTYDYFFVSALLLLSVEAHLATSVALVSHALAIVPFTIAGLLLVPGSLSALAERARAAARRRGKENS